MSTRLAYWVRLTFVKDFCVHLFGLLRAIDFVKDFVFTYLSSIRSLGCGSLFVKDFCVHLFALTGPLGVVHFLSRISVSAYLACRCNVSTSDRKLTDAEAKPAARLP